MPCSTVLGAACTADMWERLARWSNASKHLLLLAPLLVGSHEKLPHELYGLQHSLAAAAQRTCKVHLGLVPAGHKNSGTHALAVSPACRGYRSLPLASPQLPRYVRGCPQQQQAVQQSLMLPVARPWLQIQSVRDLLQKLGLLLAPAQHRQRVGACSQSPRSGLLHGILSSVCSSCCPC